MELSLSRKPIRKHTSTEKQHHTTKLDIQIYTEKSTIAGHLDKSYELWFKQLFAMWHTKSKKIKKQQYRVITYGKKEMNIDIG